MANLRRGSFWILLTALVATAAKLYCAFTTFGTEDVMLYFRFGSIVDAYGLAAAMSLQIFNLTPLAAEYPATLVALLGEHKDWFPMLLKLPGILASLGSVLALVWLQQRIPKIPTYAIILFAASPAAFMIDGFHGNFDSAVVFPILLAACACAAERPRWLLCAGFLALAAQVKVIALLTAPIFAFFWLHRGGGFKFMTVTGLLVILGWLPGILAAPTGFLKNVVGYGSVWGAWGITYLLHLTGYSAFKTLHWTHLTSEQILVSQILKLGVIAFVLVFAWRNRKGDASVLFGTLATSWVVFFALAPGMGVQYLVWFTPFLLVRDHRWYTGLTVVTSLALFAYYQITSGAIPWYRSESLRFVPYIDILLVPWISFVVCAIALLFFRRKDGAQQDEPQSLLGGEVKATDSVASF
jgi:hypothetical protein